MKKEVELCDFCNNSQKLHLAKDKCFLCGKHACKETYPEKCRALPNDKYLPRTLQSFLPFVCNDCFSLMKYKTVIDRTFSDDISKELEKLLLQETEDLRKEMKKIIDNIYRHLYRAGKKNKQKDDQKLKKQKITDEEIEETKYIPF